MRMRGLHRLALLVLCVAATGTTSACGDIFGLCETQLHICNESLSNRSHTILIDGVSYGVVEVGDCRDFDTDEGHHAVEFKFTNTNDYACSPSAPSVEKCKTKGLTCRG